MTASSASTPPQDSTEPEGGVTDASDATVSDEPQSLSESDGGPPKIAQTRRATALIVVAVIAACVAVGALWNAQAGTFLLAGAAFLGAALRMTLPAGVAFSVRRRAVDVAIMLGFAATLAFLGLTTSLG
ncbi:DUF3017 domain-containing protein [Demequina sp. B12]|uniref:DUF3017 domain-containing protein n=1 Tax=Demequina sp. B12 TaxID=2992757 RepID=UPI00237BD7E8|nr:DUF3017 domain-containing protein [Demequina sp. B12]MDE0572521.1 DUF3017 domain-containing protein [Demequina sp. B12]